MITERGRRTPERTGLDVAHPVAAGALIYAGALTVLENGLAKPGRGAPGLVALGRAEARVDNREGADGEQRIVVRQSVFCWNNDTADPVDRTHIGRAAYVVDDDTVGASDAGGTLSPAGTVVDVDADGIWVDHRRL